MYINLWCTPLSHTPSFIVFSLIWKKERRCRWFWEIRYVRYRNDLGACKLSLNFGDKSLKKKVERVEIIEIVRQVNPPLNLPPTTTPDSMVGKNLSSYSKQNCRKSPNALLHLPMINLQNSWMVKQCLTLLARIALRVGVAVEATRTDSMNILD